MKVVGNIDPIEEIITLNKDLLEVLNAQRAEIESSSLIVFGSIDSLMSLFKSLIVVFSPILVAAVAITNQNFNSKLLAIVSIVILVVSICSLTGLLIYRTRMAKVFTGVNTSRMKIINVISDTYALRQEEFNKRHKKVSKK